MSGIVEVEVAGRSYRLCSDEDGTDLQQVAALVNERVGEILSAAPGLAPERAAILAALNMGDELLRERRAAAAQAEAVEAAVEEARERLVGLAERLDEAGALRENAAGG